MNSTVLQLYLITDRAAAGSRDLFTAVEQAIRGGVTMVQLRDKTLSAAALTALAVELLSITRRFHVPLIINDYVDVMLEADADGAHLGAADMDIRAARAKAGGKIIGATAKSRERIQAAFEAGADYVGVGPVFPSSTKPDAGKILGVDGLAALTHGSPLPCVAIGGINPENAELLRNAPVAGICAAGGILGRPDIFAAAQAMRQCRP
ncbi:MAG: thiamine phosphate synthase [Lentisphaeria bacterium]|nr:thiamine phosphate synthase [Lentisphaeria bacterium]